jgi:hypothetical protein
MPVPVRKFSGHKGIVVQDTGTTPGVLDAGDLALSGGRQLAWDDPAYVAARDDYARQEARLADATRQVNAFAKALDPRTRGNAAKPERRQIDAIVTTVAGTQSGDASPALRSEAGVLAATAKGLILRDYISRIHFNEMKKVGKEAFDALKRAIADDPTNDEAWFSYGQSVLGVRHGAARGMAESTLGITVKQALPEVIEGLTKFKSSVREMLMLELILEATACEGPLTASQRTLLAEVRSLLPGLKQADPVRTAETVEKLSEHRKKVEEDARS